MFLDFWLVESNVYFSQNQTTFADLSQKKVATLSRIGKKLELRKLVSESEESRYLVSKAEGIR